MRVAAVAGVRHGHYAGRPFASAISSCSVFHFASARTASTGDSTSTHAPDRTPCSRTNLARVVGGRNRVRVPDQRIAVRLLRRDVAVAIRRRAGTVDDDHVRVEILRHALRQQPRGHVRGETRGEQHRDLDVAPLRKRRLLGRRFREGNVEITVLFPRIVRRREPRAPARGGHGEAPRGQRSWSTAPARRHRLPLRQRHRTGAAIRWSRTGTRSRPPTTPASSRSTTRRWIRWRAWSDGGRRPRRRQGKTLQIRMADARAPPSSFGVGRAPHISSVALFQTAGAKVVDVPYAAAQTVPNLLGGHVECSCSCRVRWPRR